MSGSKIAPEHKQRVRLALKRHGFPSQNALAISLGLCRATITSFFNGKPVAHINFIEISERLGLDWEEIVYKEDLPIPPVEPPSPPDLEIDWRQICRDMLEAQNQKRLTTNPLTAGDGVAFELDEIYVPLGLVERKQRERRSGDVSPEQGSQLYESEQASEVTWTFQHDEFLEKVLRQERNRRIAIIGEPGAGKTTLLQKIAAWILDDTKDVLIWISLADLQGKSLKEYLLCDWLEDATRTVCVSKEMQKALGELFNSEQVWLLLDAVDEMAVGVGAQGLAPLQLIAKEISGWVADARIVLTCRLNVWDAGKNALEAFDTYRNLDFSYGDAQTPDHVGQFIRSWFNSNPELGDRLRSELDQPGRERIKDAVKNPLRLALLCRSWALGQGGLPNTKAGLYQQFTEALYEWKQDRFPTSSATKQQLNQALGKLALRAISQEKTKFRLRHRLVCEELGNPDENLFQLALQLGWLNQVGVAAEAENQGEKVYAFFHPTFQEYFAAQAIDDWHYFLNHTPQNPAQGTYRIFEPQWKEVILLWLGREDVSKEQKEEFIKALVEFEDGCGEYVFDADRYRGFYEYRAYFLAAAGITEFGDCRHSDEIVAQLVKWSFGYFNTEEQKWMAFLAPIVEVARAILQETEPSKAIATLVQLLDSNEDKRWLAVYSLGKIAMGNQTAIAALVQLLKTTQEQFTRVQTIYSLGKIGTGNQIAVKALVQLIESTQDESLWRQAVYSLGKIGKGNQTAVKALLQLIESAQDESIRRQAVYNLGKIGQGNQTAIKALVQLGEFTDDESIRKQVADSLREINTDNPEAIAEIAQLSEFMENESTFRQVADSLEKIDVGDSELIGALVKLIESTDDESTRWQLVYKLGEIGSGNPKAIAALLQLMELTKNKYTLREAIYSLGKIGNDNSETMAALVKLIESTDDEATRLQAADSLRKITPCHQTAITALVQLIKSTQNENIRHKAAESLRKIGTVNSKTIAALLHLIQSTQDEYIRTESIARLGEIDTSSPEVIAALVQLIESTKNESIRWQVAFSLGKIGAGNPEAIVALVQLIKLTEDSFTCREAAVSLKKILQKEQLAKIVPTLKDFLSDENYENESDRFGECYKLIWHCAQNMPYPAFYQAWHSPSIPQPSPTS